MIFGNGAVSAAASSALVRTKWMLPSGAAEPPVVPVPSAAQPSYGGSTSRPMGSRVAAAGGTATRAATASTAGSSAMRFITGTTSSTAVALLELRLRFGELARELVQEVPRGHLAEQNLLEQRLGVGL